MAPPTSVWPKWRVTLAMSAVWALTWAVGLQAVYSLDPGLGWLSVGLLGGLGSASVLRRSGICQRPAYLAVLISGWVAGGLCSAGVATYDVTNGWLALGAIGGAATALSAGRRRGLRKAAQVILGALVWVGAGLLGSWSQATCGRDIGTSIGIAIGGRMTSYLISSIAWGIGGGIAGGIAGAVTALESRFASA